ncbi:MULTISPECIES: hypothetical protein [unclassified Maridesulfovibrio]|uniref:hypothetical protein n=1 Tax=unclassified Maridesulfovibrio TaxID=2794999 RepID=UPI003B3D14DE
MSLTSEMQTIVDIAINHSGNVTKEQMISLLEETIETLKYVRERVTDSEAKDDLRRLIKIIKYRKRKIRLDNINAGTTVYENSMKKLGKATKIANQAKQDIDDVEKKVKATAKALEAAAKVLEVLVKIFI